MVAAHVRARVGRFVLTVERLLFSEAQLGERNLHAVNALARGVAAPLWFTRNDVPTLPPPLLSQCVLLRRAAVIPTYRARYTVRLPAALRAKGKKNNKCPGNNLGCKAEFTGLLGSPGPPGEA